MYRKLQIFRCCLIEDEAIINKNGQIPLFVDVATIFH